MLGEPKSEVALSEIAYWMLKWGTELNLSSDLIWFFIPNRDIHCSGNSNQEFFLRNCRNYRHSGEITVMDCVPVGCDCGHSRDGALISPVSDGIF